MIDKQQLAADIKTLLDSTKTQINQQNAINSFSDSLADYIANAIKRGIDTATITQVQTAGSDPVVGTLTITATK